MNMNDPVMVYTLDDPLEAEVVKNALRSQGIPCELDGQRQAALSHVLQIGVLVRAQDADRARRLIRGHQTQRARQDESPPTAE